MYQRFQNRIHDVFSDKIDMLRLGFDGLKLTIMSSNELGIGHGNLYFR